MEALREHQAAWVELWLVHGARAGQRVRGRTKNGAGCGGVRDSVRVACYHLQTREPGQASR